MGIRLTSPGAENKLEGESMIRHRSFEMASFFINARKPERLRHEFFKCHIKISPISRVILIALRQSQMVSRYD
jgi:hypothetical protein